MKYALLGTNILLRTLFSRGRAVGWLGQALCSIPDEVIGFFNLPNPSSRTMALKSTQPLIEMSIRNLPVGKGLPDR
jgi:hypothetical protein